MIDNGSCHNLDGEEKLWLELAESHRRIELFRLPAHSPEFNPIEGLWKLTKKRTIHNTFFRTTSERDAALTATFEQFPSSPSPSAPQLARFL